MSAPKLNSYSASTPVTCHTARPVGVFGIDRFPEPSDFTPPDFEQK
jgi:hypothetical protein